MPVKSNSGNQGAASLSGIFRATKRRFGCLIYVSLIPKMNRGGLWLLLCTLTALAGAGCSGINASRSFSPLDFLLPGLLHIENSPQGQPLQQATNSVVVLAQSR